MAFIFGGNTPWSYEELQRQRAVAESLLAGAGAAPRNVGEGLNAIGKALAYRGLNKRAGKEEARMKDEHATLRGSIFGGYGGGASAPSSAAPAFGGGGGSTHAPRDPNSPEGVAADAMAALGKGPGMDRLSGVDPRIDEVVRLAANNLGITLGVSEGLRDVETQKKYVAEGKSQTMNSKHLHGNAVDYYIVGPDGKANWDFEAYRPLAEEAKRIAAEKGYDGFGWGGDWKTLKDGVHFQFDGHDHSADPQVPATQQEAVAAATPQGGAPSGGMDLGALLAYAAHPMTSPGEKAIVEQLIAQQTQAADPMKAIELEKAQLELAQMKNGEGASATEYGTTLQFFNDPKDGKLRAGVIGKDGTFKEVPPPDGGDWATGVEKVDAGTKWVFINKRDGSIISEQPKDLRGAETEKAIGQAQGEAAGEAVVGLDGALAKGQQAINLIDQIYNDPALPSILGIVQGNIPAGTPIIGGGQAGANLDAKIKQLQGQVFLEAFESLKGAGQITEIEGTKAEQAKARLQRAQDPEAYQAALAELREVIDGSMKRAKSKAAAAGTPKATASSGDFATMGIAEIGQVDIGSLTPEQMDALEARMTELGL
jgi:D-alanyl-D-alanine carboxypeptidase